MNSTIIHVYFLRFQIVLMTDLYNNAISEEDKKLFWKRVGDTDTIDAAEIVKQCCCVNGIPDHQRSAAWKFLLSKTIEEEVGDNSGSYEELAASDDSELKDVIADIDADIEKCGVEDEKKAVATRNTTRRTCCTSQENVLFPERPH